MSDEYLTSYGQRSCSSSPSLKGSREYFNIKDAEYLLYKEPIVVIIQQARSANHIRAL